MSLTGNAIQGGLMKGKVAPGDTVTFNQNTVKQTQGQEFVIGFGRDAPLSHTLVITSAEGQQWTHEIKLEKRDYKIQRIDGLPPRKVNPNPEALTRIRQEAALVREARSKDNERQDFFQQTFEWPLVGPITGVYGSQRILNGEPKRPHYGLDIAAKTGAQVVAPASGLVVFAHDDLYFSGGTLIVDHGHGLSSTFIHLHKILVEEGQTINQGDPIAEVGATGRATGPHLDWRMNWFGERVDPGLLVGPMPTQP